MTETVRVYDEGAPALAQHMGSIGSRRSQIDHAIYLGGNQLAPLIVEIGCGDGRDAEDIAPQSLLYLGFDPAAGMIELAKARNLGHNARFTQADALSFNYTEFGHPDVIFAFASLLHLNEDDLQEVFAKVDYSLAPSGVFYITLKGADMYKEVVYDDDFVLDDGSHVEGHRTFYYYTPRHVLELAKGLLEPVYERDELINGIRWLTFAFKPA